MGCVRKPVLQTWGALARFGSQCGLLVAGAAGLLCKESTACSVPWASSSGVGCQRGGRAAGPSQCLCQPCRLRGCCGGRAPSCAGAGVPSSRGLRVRAVGQGAEWDSSERMGPSLGMGSVRTAFSRMSCWEKILMINVFCGDKLKALCARCPSAVVCAGLRKGLAPSFEVMSVCVFCW